MTDGVVPGSKQEAEHREPSGCGPDRVGSGVGLKTHACPWGAGKRSRYQRPLSAALEVNRPRIDIHLRCPPHLSLHCPSLSPRSPSLLHWRHEGKQREGETDRDKEAASHLGGHLEPLPQLPQTHHMFGYGKTNPALGPREAGKKGGSLVHSGTGGTSAKMPKLRRRRGGETRKVQ